MVEVFVPDLTTIITQFVLVAGLVLGAVKWLESKSEKKRLKTEQETKAAAAELKAEIDRSAEQVRTDHLAHLAELKANGESTKIILETKIEAVDAKVREMLDDLQRRADFTNEAVSSIRTDIADLQDDLETLSEESASGLRKRNVRKRREKHRTIERDRIEQSKHGRG